MPRTRVKICGLTRAEDVLAAAEAGADAVGFVFAQSPRRVSAELAAGLCMLLPPFVQRVGVFVDASDDEIFSAVNMCRLTMLQFCGSETPQRCASMPLPVAKVFRVSDGFSFDDANEYRGAASAILLDTYDPISAGGTGMRFHWENVGQAPEGLKVIAAGGLHAANVGECIRMMRPDAVDVSSGVESAPGIKDAALMQAFCEAVRKADEEAAG